MPEYIHSNELHRSETPVGSAQSRAKLSRTLLVVLGFCALARTADAQGVRKRIAVLPMDTSPSVTATTGRARTGEIRQTVSAPVPPPDEFARGMTEMLTTALVGTDAFVVVERAALDDVLAEQERSTDGLMASDRGVRSGALLGAQILVRASVTSYAFERSESGGAARVVDGIKALQGLGVSRSSESASVVIDVRLIDAETGQVIASEAAEGEARSTTTTVSTSRDEGDLSFGSMDATPLGEASRAAIDRAVAFIVERLGSLPWEGRVAEVDVDGAGRTVAVYVNAGTRIGLTVGAILAVARPGRSITDPESGVIIGRTRDTPIGTIHVVQSMSELCVAEPDDASVQYAVGDVVTIDFGGNRP